MNLSPLWAEVLIAAWFEAIHWTRLGLKGAPDSVVLSTTKEEGAVLLTHDLDFGAILAFSGDQGPSVVQLREQDVDPESIGVAVVAAIRQHQAALELGAILTIDLQRAKVRLLPIRR